MQDIQGDQAMSARDAARFHVPTFAQRRAEERAWQERQDGARQRHLAQRQRQTPAAQRDEREQRARRPIADEETIGTAPRTGLRGPRSSLPTTVGEWETARDARREQVRSRLAPLDDVASAAGRARQQLGVDKLDELDRRLAAEDSSYERGSIKKDLGEPLAKADKVLARVEAIAGAPSRAVEKIDQGWLQRRDRIEGAMDRVGSYVDRRERRLSVDRGGSGDADERRARSRQRWLERRRERIRERQAERRREAREQEERDDRRRQQALRRRQERRAEER